MIAPNAAEVLNLVGFVTGTALYAMLLALVLRNGKPRGVPLQALPLATAVLGLIWNLGELSAYALPRLGYFNESIALWAVSFPALGLLAAVVVHSVARELPRGFALTAVAYGCSAAASVLHLATVITGDPEPSSIAFLLLTVCYSLIIVALAVMTRAQANGAARAVGARAGAVRRLGVAPWPIPCRRRWLGGGAGGSSRRHPAGVRDPLPGLPVRARRSVPQARADADRDRRDRLRRLHRRDDAAGRTASPRAC